MGSVVGPTTTYTLNVSLEKEEDLLQSKMQRQKQLSALEYVITNLARIV